MDIILIVIIIALLILYFYVFHNRFGFDFKFQNLIEKIKKANWYYIKQKQLIILYSKDKIEIELISHIKKMVKSFFLVFLVMLLITIMSGFERIMVLNTIIFPILVVYKYDSDLKNKSKKYSKDILMQCPELFYQMSILLSSGLNIDVVIQNIYENTYENGGIKFFLDKVYFEMERGESLICAIDSVAQDLNIRAINKFGVIIKQCVENGMNHANVVLMELSEDTMRELQFEIKQSAEKLSSKLMLPLMISLSTLMFMLAVPVMMQM